MMAKCIFRVSIGILTVLKFDLKLRNIHCIFMCPLFGGTLSFINIMFMLHLLCFDFWKDLKFRTSDILLIQDVDQKVKYTSKNLPLGDGAEIILTKLATTNPNYHYHVQVVFESLKT